ncbi:MAG: glycoside hydrolase family 38 C-terminal domain-containing protein [bacterium]|nr:glycoside hydrolase family 38 C-terminal domain-containing protein [bacterium]
MARQKEAHVVSHTHWDREWYLTFQQYRMRLVDVIDQVIDLLENNPGYKYFTLDGQTVVLEDYFEIKPENRERVEKLVKAGKLMVGPFYILPDEFLISEEAHIRNLLLGHKIAEEVGAVMKVGYIPDPFGHISQMPQILQGFGIDNFIFTRGVEDMQQSEFWWQAPDGTKVLAIYQPQGYCNARWMSVDKKEELDRIKQLYCILSEMASTPNLLFNNGCDHLPPQPELPEVLKGMEEVFPETKFIHSTFQAYIDKIKKANPKLKTRTGELRGNKEQYLLYGVQSARMYLKQNNDRAQVELTKYAEPFSAFAWSLGGIYLTGALWRAWRYLMQNHPHDSICGCSIDAVHRQMLTRFDWAQELAEEVSNRAKIQIADQIDTSDLKTNETALVVFNPLNWERSETFQTEINFEHPGFGKVKGIRIFDEGNTEIPVQVSDITTEILTYLHPQKQPHLPRVYSVKASFPVDNIPACGYKTYRVAPLIVDNFNLGAPIAYGNILENEYLRVEVNPNGSLNILHKETETEYQNCLIYEDGADAGDEYNYSHPRKDTIITTEFGAPQITLVDNGPLAATVKIEGTLCLPASLTPDFHERVTETVECSLTTYVTLTKGSPRVDIVTEFDNNAKDHRLRALFPNGIKTNSAFAEGHFDVVQRAIALPQNLDEYTTEHPPLTHPQLGFVDVNDGEVGLTIINQGLPEYEVIDDAKRTIALTLFRAVGWLSHYDLLTRQLPAGPHLPTPEAQCLGKHRFKFSILPHSGSWSDAAVYRQAYQFNVGFGTHQTESHKGKLPKSFGFVSVEPKELVVTAIKKSEKEGFVILRFYNIGEKTVQGKVRFGKPVKQVYLADLSEKRQQKLEVANNKSVQLAVAKKKIITLAVQFT